ncbi:MAG: hypothetical protein DSY66_02750, partial [Persephonella sp.]
MNRVKVSIGHSGNLDKAINKALEKVKNPNLIIVFFSPKFNPNEIYTKIRDKVGKNTEIIGTSTAGEISNETDCSVHTVSIAAIESPYINIGVGVGKDLSKNILYATEQSIIEATKSLDKNKRMTTINILQRAYIKKSLHELL